MRSSSICLSLALQMSQLSRGASLFWRLCRLCRASTCSRASIEGGAAKARNDGPATASPLLDIHTPYVCMWGYATRAQAVPQYSGVVHAVVSCIYLYLQSFTWRCLSRHTPWKRPRFYYCMRLSHIASPPA